MKKETKKDITAITGVLGWFIWMGMLGAYENLALSGLQVLIGSLLLILIYFCTWLLCWG